MENTTNETVLQQARDEIWQSWRRTCAANADHPRADELFDRNKLPAFHDPFAGGGSLPLEAQRLGLEAHASDLNPVAVLINKAMIEIPPKFAGKPPVNPETRGERRLTQKHWRGAEGLAEDVRYYGQWMRDEAEQRIGHLYPKVRVTTEMAADRPDLEPYVGRELTVIAWLWARTVKSPNPAFADVDVPLASTFILSKKKGKEAWVEPVIKDEQFRFEVRAGVPPDSAKSGTKLSRGSFRCLFSQTPMSYEYIDEEANDGRMDARLMAIVAEGDRARVYLSPTPEMEGIAQLAAPTWKPTLASRGTWASNAQGRRYGFHTFGDYFADRQMVALTTFADLVSEARERVRRDAVAAGLSQEEVIEYANLTKIFLAICVSKSSDSSCTIARWQNAGDFVAGVFSRQAIPMLWDYAEANLFSASTQNWMGQVNWVAKAVQLLPYEPIPGYAFQSDAAALLGGDNGSISSPVAIFSTDPPYYDNVGYADLSDFFYVWLRSILHDDLPDLFATLGVPKDAELVATPYRHESKQKAEEFFLSGMSDALSGLAGRQLETFPLTIYYAFKQSEVKDEGLTSTGWETFLDATIHSGLAISGTWPMRTERGARALAIGTNALASSVVLVCRPRNTDAPTATRREFQDILRSQFPKDLKHLQRSNIAPVDLAQASIGPGMRIFTEYREVLNADGSAMTVREALALINATLDEVLAEQEGDFDPDTRWALTWFEQHGFEEGEFGDADTLSKAKGTSVEGVVQAGLAEARRGDVRLLRASELDPEWDPATDRRIDCLGDGASPDPSAGVGGRGGRRRTRSRAGLAGRDRPRPRLSPLRRQRSHEASRRRPPVQRPGPVLARDHAPRATPLRHRPPVRPGVRGRVRSGQTRRRSESWSPKRNRSSKQASGCCKEVAERIVKHAKPEQIWLLGGTATGQGAWIDVDLLIVLPGEWDYRERQATIGEAARIRGIGFYSHLATPQQFTQYQERKYIPPHFNLDESRMLYERQ